jgi:hypothetical protein
LEIEKKMTSKRRRSTNVATQGKNSRPLQK